MSLSQMKTLTSELTLDALLQLCPNRLKKIYHRYIADIPALPLKTAIEYTLLNGGKNLRALLIYATGTIFNAPLENLDIPAAAVEVIHTYSLIHDDLPCMDNADLRRGKAACHKVHGEGMAVLTGDALHSLAMQIIADHPASLQAEKRLQMIQVLSHACGPYGMAAGQALDITVMNSSNISSELLTSIYQLKTGALFTACTELGRLASNDEDEINHQALRLFGERIGLAFQIQDDIIDIESTGQLSGKNQGLDAINNKITYPRLHQLTEAKEKAKSLYLEALETINYLGSRAQLLRDLTTYMLQR